MWGATGRVPALWGHDDDAGALLLERVRPGGRLASGAGAGPLIAALHVVPPPGVPPLAERVASAFDVFESRNGPVAAERALALELASSWQGPDVLLHGDLHPGNVLDGGPSRGPVAIDPRPCTGDPAFDAIDWVDGERAVGALAREAGVDPVRLAGWRDAFAPWRR